MTNRVQAAGVYGLVNGLGYRGDRDVKSRLIRSAQRAAGRGDWDTIVQMGLAYLLGSALGSSVRQRWGAGSPGAGSDVRW
jgi:hypothetical protein